MISFLNYILHIIIIIGAVSVKKYDTQILRQCETPNNHRGECIRLTECPPLKNILRGDLTNKERDLLRRSQCGPIGSDGNVWVCCPRPSSSASERKCETADNRRGKCIPITECKSLSNILRPGLSNKDREFLRRSRCGPIGNDGIVLVCCPPSSPLPRMNSGNVLPIPGVCGLGKFEKINGITKTKIDEFPWTAILVYGQDIGSAIEGSFMISYKDDFYCSGSLINNRYILTAALCINNEYGKIPKRVRLGEWNTETNLDCDELDPTHCSDNPIDVEIEETIIHENYNSSSVNQLDNIALLRLSRSIEYTDWIKPICLPISENLRSASFEGVTLNLVGWGNPNRNNNPSDVKLKMQVEGISLDSCNEKFKKYVMVHFEHTQMCAKTVDFCHGDTGGALISLDRSNVSQPFYFVVGLMLSDPVPCLFEDWLRIYLYTRVGSYVDWIQNNLRS